MVKFQFLNELVLECKGSNYEFKSKFIPCLKAYKLIAKGCIYHNMRVRDVNSKTPLLDSIPNIVNEFPYVFLDDLPGISPKKKLILV